VSSIRLPLLAPHEAALETCVFCPKLSRAACPVSNAEASETTTPWGKMSMAYFLGRGDVPLDAEHASTAWACSACYACRERCEHKNEVATVLSDARAEAFAAGAAPEGAREVAARFAERSAEAARAIEGIARGVPAVRTDDRGATAVLVGCDYARHAPDVARDALAAVAALVGGPVRPVRACCGLPLLHAGDRGGFVTAARALADEVRTAARLVVVDPGCARTLAVEYPRLGIDARPAELFVDLAMASIDRLRRGPDASLPGGGAPVRWHDPCQLGRGLGRYEEPRRLLARITGHAPTTFLRERGEAECSGGGGLLPVTRPETSAAIADARIAEHRARGGGVLVTGCAGSLRRFRSRGEPAEDLVTFVARALGVSAAVAPSAGA
jgi:Fe-S oxidoreductase